MLDWSLKMWPDITPSTLPARMVRPVRHLEHQRVEWVTPMEQVHMHIAVTPQEVGRQTTDLECCGCTPFSDNNQSPRNTDNFLAWLLLRLERIMDSPQLFDRRDNIFPVCFAGRPEAAAVHSLEQLISELRALMDMASGR